MENNYVAAVDLGTTKVVMAVGRRAEKNKVEIVAVKEHASRGVIKGDLRNNEQAFASIVEVKNKIEQELGITVADVYIGISGQHIKCSRATGYVFVHNSDSTVSEVSGADVKRLIDDMHNSALPVGQTIITVLPQTYKIDDENDITEPIGMEGKRLEAQFNLIVGEDAAIDRIGRCFVRAGMEVAGITLQPLASSYAVLSEDEKELGVAVVDIGGGTTDLCIYHDKIIRHIAVLPIGGGVVNNDIKSYGILERHVEKLKTTFGEAVAERAPDQKYVTIPSINGQAPKEIAIRALAGIIEARMYDIIDFVASQIDKCGYKGKLGAGVVLTGGGSMLKNLDILFRNQLNCEIRVASPTQHLTQASIELFDSPKYSTIAGLLIDAVRNGHLSHTEQIFRPVETASIPAAVTAASSSSSYDESTSYAHPVSINNSVDQTYGDLDSQQQDSSYDSSQDYSDEQPAADEEFGTGTHRTKRGMFGRLKDAFGKMFEEVDAEDNY